MADPALQAGLIDGSDLSACAPTMIEERFQTRVRRYIRGGLAKTVAITMPTGPFSRETLEQWYN